METVKVYSKEEAKIKMFGNGDARPGYRQPQKIVCVKEEEVKSFVEVEKFYNS